MSELNENSIGLLSTTASVDLKATAGTKTNLYTVPSGKTLIISEIWLKASADVGAAGGIYIGSSTDTTNYTFGTTVVSTTPCLLTNLNAANDVIIIKPGIHVGLTAATPQTNKAYPAGTIIQVEIKTATTNAATGTFYLFGFLF
jgi:hypothetical protein